MAPKNLLALYDCTYSSAGEKYPLLFSSREDALKIVRQERRASDNGSGRWDFAVYDIREEK